ncbi:hypothetical protein PT974_03195 [Cladobotryum mycophilum]|uniref:Uncharacterized protein n=1 Tax=Cladobotryum mycophilum TaxID=491253 RepID=A0ABR0SRL5_9HYPO
MSSQDDFGLKPGVHDPMIGDGSDMDDEGGMYNQSPGVAVDPALFEYGNQSSVVYQDDTHTIDPGLLHGSPQPMDQYSSGPIATQFGNSQTEA